MYKDKTKQKEYNKQYKDLHKTETKLYNETYKLNHKEETKTYNQKYHNDNLSKERNRSKKYYENHREQEKTRGRKYYSTLTTETLMFQAAKMRAKRDNIPFNICKEDIIVGETCPILHIPLCRSKNVVSDNSPTLDKIIPSHGYTKNNVQVISNKANSMKRNASLEELIKLGKWAEEKLLNMTN